MVLTYDDQPVTPGVERSVCVEPRAFGGQRAGRGVARTDGIETLIGKIRKARRALVHGETASTVLMHTRPDVDVWWNNVADGPIRRATDEHDPTAFGRTSLQP